MGEPMRSKGASDDDSSRDDSRRNCSSGKKSESGEHSECQNSSMATRMVRKSKTTPAASRHEIAKSEGALFGNPARTRRLKTRSIGVNFCRNRYFRFGSQNNNKPIQSQMADERDRRVSRR